ncbi:hypothetical protein QYE76_003274 [Lolium multiflorum]|uniref:AAA+ ATPase domain-containing protein n=1 Tax=Lolium multiflorum TaxID=4521 RepID=A0AAD8RPY7_LOLMU|nr:hypothetical protein QYE76_003274 [Lolium multiflorum]
MASSSSYSGDVLLLLLLLLLLRENAEGYKGASVLHTEIMNRPDERDHGEDKEAEAERKIKGAINKLLEAMRPLPKRMLDMLEQHRGRRGSSVDDPQLRSLEFIQAELSGMVESLHQLQSSKLGPDYIGNDHFKKWLRALSLLPASVNEYLDKSDQAVQSGCHAQLHRVVAYRFLRAAGLPLPFLRGFKDIEETLSLLAERPFRYSHIRLADDGNGTTSTQPHTDHTDLVGIEDALRNKVVRRFMDDGDGNENARVISIVGPAGVGKTTLAKVIYNKLQERGHGCATARVVVSPRPDRKELLKNILSQIRLPEIRTPPDEQELPQLVDDIKTNLKDRRYIILIDDMWKASDWDAIKDVFPQNKMVSRIIITTSIRSVAETCCLIGDVHEVKPLCEKDSNTLFHMRTFGSQVRNTDHLQQLCHEEILRRCGGIPLFILGMADWLKEGPAEYLKRPMTRKEFELILSPTYDNLPYWLKVPVLYISMFPQGYMFEKNSFTEKLAAELLADSNATAEDYFVELVDRNVITQVKVQEAESSYWQVNYFMLQFLASKSADIGFVYTSGTLRIVAGEASGSSSEGGGGGGEGGGKKPRRLSLHQTDPDLPALLAEMGLSQTRSLAVSGTVDKIPLDKFICLMVLDLEGWKRFEEQNWLPICKMYLLRYLSLRNTCVTGVPPEIEELGKLETLNLSHTMITELPSQVCELSELRMFDLRGTPVTELPAGIRKMRQLRRLLLGGNGVDLVATEVTKVPEEIGNLQCLDTIGIDLSESSDSLVKALGRVWKLRVVTITLSVRQSTDMKFLEELCSSIEQWKNLESLTIKCGLGCSMEFLGSDLLTLPAALMEFKVRSGRVFILPTWLGKLGRLAFIEISICKLTTDDLRTLGNLGRLQDLVLDLHLLPEEAIVIVGEGLFPKLQKLSIGCRVPWMTFRKGAMPKLTYLELNIGGSPASGESIPSGIFNLRSLSDVAINYNKCYDDTASVRATNKAVKKEAVGHHNMINLVINGIIKSQQLDDVQAIEEGPTSATGNKE